MLKNATPHRITIYAKSAAEFVAAVRKNVLVNGAQPLMSIEPSGLLLNAKSDEKDADAVGGVPVKVVVWSADSIPDGDDVYIVSALYKSAARDKDKARLLTVGGVIYASKDDPKPVGCLFLSR